MNVARETAFGSVRANLYPQDPSFQPLETIRLMFATQRAKVSWGGAQSLHDQWHPKKLQATHDLQDSDVLLETLRIQHATNFANWNSNLIYTHTGNALYHYYEEQIQHMCQPSEQQQQPTRWSYHTKKQDSTSVSRVETPVILIQDVRSVPCKFYTFLVDISLQVPTRF